MLAAFTLALLPLHLCPPAGATTSPSLRNQLFKKKFLLGTDQKMKPWLAEIVLITLVAVIQTERLPFEGVDVDSILKNRKIISRHIKCVREEGRCDSNGKNLKSMLPRIINEGCTGCSYEQVTNSNKVIDWMRAHRPEDWHFIKAKYTV